MKENMMKKKTLPPALLFTACLLPATASHAAVIYENDFQTAVGSEWTHTTLQNTPTPYPFGARSFLGEFSNDTVSLNLSSLSQHNTIHLQFDLYLIRSWDGSSTGTAIDYGNDIFKLAIGNGTVLLEDTFSNGNPAGQSFGSAANNPYHAGAAEAYSLGYTFYDGIQQSGQVMDSVYRFNFEFTHSASLLTLNFSGNGLQSIDDESWGLDNVRVSAVPEPATAPLLGLGILALGWHLRQRRTA